MNSILSALCLVFSLSCQATSIQEPSEQTATASAGGGAGVGAGAGAGAVAWVAGAAQAQQAKGKDFSQLSVNNDKGSLLLVLHNDGKATAIVDGELLPRERIVREDDHLKVQDADGGTLFDIRVLPGGGLGYPYDATSARVMRVDNAWSTATSDQMTDEMRAQAEEWSKPRRMIGVTTVPLDPALAAQLDSKPDEAILVSEVFSDLPAERAGVQVYDVVVRIDGETPVTPERLRAAIKAKPEGEELTLSIIRAGKPMELRVGVEEVSGDKLARTWGGSGTLWDTTASGGLGGDGSAQNIAELYRLGYVDLKGQNEELAAAQVQLETAREEIADQLEQLRQQQEGAASDSERKHMEEVHANLEAAMARVSDASAKLAAEAAQSQGGAGFLSGNDGTRSLIVPMRSGTAADAADSAAIKKMDERFAQVEDRMKRLEDMLQRLVDASGKPATPAPSDGQH